MKLCPRSSIRHKPASPRSAHSSLSPSPSTSPTMVASALPQHTTHTYTLEQSSFPYCTLTLASAAHSPDARPTFHGPAPTIAGAVVVELSKMRAIRDVLITVTGRLHTPGAAPSVFLTHTTSLLTTPQPTAQTSSLDGTHTLPFALRLPPVTAAGSPLPPSWASALSPCKIEYSLALVVRRKSRLPSACAEDSLAVPITYLPHPMKQPLRADPQAEEWHRSSAPLRGAQIGQRAAAELRSTLALPTPLAYPSAATGPTNSIPFSLTLSDPKHVAPDVLAAPIAISVDLRRAVRYIPASPPPKEPFWCALCKSHDCGCNREKCPLSLAAAAVGEWSWEAVAAARCWQVPHSSPHVRLVQGEIPLPELEPSFAFAGLEVSYAVHVRFSAPGEEHKQEHFAFVQPVTILASSPYPPSSTTSTSSSPSYQTSYTPSTTSSSSLSRRSSTAVTRTSSPSSSSASSIYSSPKPYADDPPPYTQSPIADSRPRYATRRPLPPAPELAWMPRMRSDEALLA